MSRPLRGNVPDLIIRDIELPRDEAAAISFIDGLQHYERAFEPDRRIDSHVAADYFAELMQRVSEKAGRVFVAEEDGRAIGWAVFIVEENPLFVVTDQRTYGYVDELFVVESARSRGVGRQLIGACEDEARRRGLSQVKIGVLARNTRSAEIYARAGYAPYALELRKYL